jgi:hypothetical protein
MHSNFGTENMEPSAVQEVSGKEPRRALITRTQDGVPYEGKKKPGCLYWIGVFALIPFVGTAFALGCAHYFIAYYILYARQERAILCEYRDEATRVQGEVTRCLEGFPTGDGAKQFAAHIAYEFDGTTYTVVYNKFRTPLHIGQQLEVSLLPGFPDSGRLTSQVERDLRQFYSRAVCILIPSVLYSIIVINSAVCGWVPGNKFDGLMKTWSVTVWCQFWTMYFFSIVLAVAGLLFWNRKKRHFRQVAQAETPIETERFVEQEDDETTTEVIV